MRSRQHPCRCSHEHFAHVHYRRGSDCGVCGPQGCGKYRADRHAVAVPPPAEARAPQPA